MNTNKRTVQPYGENAERAAKALVQLEQECYERGYADGESAAQPDRASVVIAVGVVGICAAAIGAIVTALVMWH